MLDFSTSLEMTEVSTSSIQHSNLPLRTTLQPSSQLITHAYTLLLFFGIGISIFLFLTRYAVTRIISTESFTTTILHGFTSIDAMAIVVWIFLCYFVSSLATYILIAHGRQRSMMYLNAGIALFNIIGNILVIPNYSFVGSAIVTLISQIFLLICTWWMVRSDLPLRSILPQTLRVLSIGIIAGLGAFWIGNIIRIETLSLIGSMESLALIGWTFSFLYLGGFALLRKRLG